MRKMLIEDADFGLALEFRPICRFESDVRVIVEDSDLDHGVLRFIAIRAYRNGPQPNSPGKVIGDPQPRYFPAATLTTSVAASALGSGRSTKRGWRPNSL